MQKPVNVWWSITPKPGNLGDIITPNALAHFGVNFRKVAKTTDGKLLATGSIVRFAKDKDIIWGSGMIDRKDKINHRSRYLCVRGPITGQRTRCDMIGDPGLLMPLIYPATYDKSKHELAIIPHYIDKHASISIAENKIDILTNNVEHTCKLIAAQNGVISSSLHGIIIAHAYGIPAGWWKPSNNLTGDDVKFLDYAESVNIQLTPESDYRRVKLVRPAEVAIATLQKNLITTLSYVK